MYVSIKAAEPPSLPTARNRGAALGQMVFGPHQGNGFHHEEIVGLGS